MQTVTILVGCKNRLSFLVDSISTWLDHDRVKEIIIVDWSSDVPIDKKCFNQQEKIRVLRVIGENERELPWHLSGCINFGLQHVTTPHVLKLDADTRLHPDFFNQHPLRPGMFYRGDYRLAREENEQHLNGVLFVHLYDILHIGGYNEYIQSYGYDDTDLYERLVKSGLKETPFHLDALSHIPHSNSLRSKDDIQLSTTFNMFVSKRCTWSNHNFKKNYKTVYQYAPPSLPCLTPSIFSECDHLAKRCILNDHHGIYWSLTQNKDVEFINELFLRRKQPKFILRAINGLGNKWRTIASAAVICDSLNYLLITEWIPDTHCSSTFKELFNDQNMLVCDSPYKMQLQTSSNSSSSSSCSSSSAFDQNMHHDITKQGYFSITSACHFSSAYTSYQKERKWVQSHFHPIPRLSKMIQSLEEKMSLANCIGVHSRRGQSISSHPYEDYKTWSQKQIESCIQSRQQSHYLYFIREMKRLRLLDPNQSFFICADRKSTYAAFRDVFVADPHLYFNERQEFNRSTNELEAAVIDVSLLSKTKYLLGSPWSTFTELVGRLGGIKTRVAGQDFPTSWRALLMYQDQLGQNLGDNIQTLAASQWFNHDDFDYFINRNLTYSNECVLETNPSHQKTLQRLIQYNDLDDDTVSISEEKRLEMETLLPSPIFFLHQTLSKKKIKVIWSCWFDGRVTEWPLPSYIDPLFISLHLNESKDLFSQPNYSHIIHLKEKSLFDSQEKIDYWLKHAPIGCRDQHTIDLFTQYKIPTYYSSCLTLSLVRQHDDEKDKSIYVVDSHILEPQLFQSIVPKSIQLQAVFLTHVTEKRILPNLEKLEKAKHLLTLYQKAKYVITSRLHCALPCLAYGVPILFLNSTMDKDVRFDDTLKSLLGNGQTIPHDWNWINPIISNEKKEIISNFRKIQHEKIHAFLTRP